MRQIPRLFIDQPLSEGASVVLDTQQAHYLGRVLRLEEGAELRLLDDRTGEWRATIAHAGKKQMLVRADRLERVRESVPDVWLLAAPIRPERFAWTIEKATELGVARIVPILSERVNHPRLKPDKLRAHMVEAAEQCGRTALPVLGEAESLVPMLARWPQDRTLYFADEAGGLPLSSLGATCPAAILIGPEGGFSDAERQAVLAVGAARRMTLGANILRADTAAVAAIAQFQLCAGQTGRQRATQPD